MKLGGFLALFVALVLSSAGYAKEWHVWPQGKPEGDGSVQKPWDLQTALSQPAAVKPGDTIWLHSGTYTREWNDKYIFHSDLTGTADAPIIVRPYPNEYAIIDGGGPASRVNWTTLEIYGAYTWYWGFEVTDSNPARADTSKETWTISSGKNGGVNVFGPHTKLINLIVHDCSSGVNIWRPAKGAEMYGCIIYYCGWQGADRAHGHALYTQNEEGTKLIAENITFDCFGWGLHAYGGGNTFVRDFDFIGNVSFNNGSIRAENSNNEDLIVVGGRPGTKRNIRVEDNFTYTPSWRTGGGVEVGWNWDGVNLNATVKNNHFVGGTFPVAAWRWNEIVFTGNTISSNADSVGAVLLSLLPEQSTAKYQWDTNAYYDACKRLKFNDRSITGFADWQKSTGLDEHSTYTTDRPKGVWSFVRPNKYEPGRAHIIIYNWDLKDSVDVDISALGLQKGEICGVWDAQRLLGFGHYDPRAPLLYVSYDGKPISIRMKDLPILAPVGKVPVAPKHTAPEFGVFVVMKARPAE